MKKFVIYFIYHIENILCKIYLLQNSSILKKKNIVLFSKHSHNQLLKNLNTQIFIYISLRIICITAVSVDKNYLIYYWILNKQTYYLYDCYKFISTIYYTIHLIV